MLRTSEPLTIALATGNGVTADQPTIDDLAFSLVAALHRHPHLSNVLTHISRSSWPRIEQTLRIILEEKTQQRDLTPLTRNILELMCAERGDTGRIFKPYFRYLLTALAGPNRAKALWGHIEHLATPAVPDVIAMPELRATAAGAAIYA